MRISSDMGSVLAADRKYREGGKGTVRYVNPRIEVYERSGGSWSWRVWIGDGDLLATGVNPSFASWVEAELAAKDWVAKQKAARAAGFDRAYRDAAPSGHYAEVRGESARSGYREAPGASAAKYDNGWVDTSPAGWAVERYEKRIGTTTLVVHRATSGSGSSWGVAIFDRDTLVREGVFTSREEAMWQAEAMHAPGYREGSGARTTAKYGWHAPQPFVIADPEAYARGHIGGNDPAELAKGLDIEHLRYIVKSMPNTLEGRAAAAELMRRGLHAPGYCDDAQSGHYAEVRAALARASEAVAAIGRRVESLRFSNANLVAAQRAGIDASITGSDGRMVQGMLASGTSGAPFAPGFNERSR